MKRVQIVLTPLVLPARSSFTKDAEGLMRWRQQVTLMIAARLGLRPLSKLLERFFALPEGNIKREVGTSIIHRVAVDEVIPAHQMVKPLDSARRHLCQAVRMIAPPQYVRYMPGERIERLDRALSSAWSTLNALLSDTVGDGVRTRIATRTALKPLRLPEDVAEAAADAAARIVVHLDQQRAHTEYFDRVASFADDAPVKRSTKRNKTRGT